jgi:uncharacterized protein
MKAVLKNILLCIVVLSLFSVKAFAVSLSRVDDAADLIADYEEGLLADSLADFTLATDFSAVVLTIDYAEGKTSQQYADDYLDSLVLYEGWEENSILFLIDMDNREVCISTMGECINVYALYIDYIIDSGYNELLNENYSECFNLMITAATEYYSDNYYGDYYADDFYGDYQTDEDLYYAENNFHSDDSVSISNIFICFVIALIIGAVSVFAVKNSYKNMGKGDEFDADDLILNLTGSNDTVISRNVITTRVPKNNNSRSGGGSSGGVSHRSSGGFSHGGGSRKF